MTSATVLPTMPATITLPSHSARDGPPAAIGKDQDKTFRVRSEQILTTDIDDSSPVYDNLALLA